MLSATCHSESQPKRNKLELKLNLRQPLESLRISYLQLREPRPIRKQQISLWPFAQFQLRSSFQTCFENACSATRQLESNRWHGERVLLRCIRMVIGISHRAGLLRGNFRWAMGAKALTSALTQTRRTRRVRAMISSTVLVKYISICYGVTILSCKRSGTAPARSQPGTQRHDMTHCAND